METTTTIQKFSKEGFGIGSINHPNGTTEEIEIPFSVPGDQLSLSLSKKKKGARQGNLLALINPSPIRITPKCPHFSHCGSCRWQQIPYANQLEQKQDWVNQLIQPFLTPQSKLYPIIPCDPPWQYRNKIELTFSSDKSQNQFLGFILYGTRGHVFNLDECYLVPSWMVEAVKIIRSWWKESGLDAYHPHKDTGSLRTLTLREGKSTGDRMIILTVSGNPSYALKKDNLKSFKETIQQSLQPADGAELSIFIRIQQIAKGTPTQFYEMHVAGPDHISEKMSLPGLNGTKKEFTFQISPVAFFQPNSTQAEKLYTRVLEMVEIPKDAFVLDLYCGTGTLGIAFSHFAKEVVGIELMPESVIDARENIKINGLDNITIRQGDVGQLLPILLKEKGKYPDIVLVDPPRVGLDPTAIRHLLESQAPIIIYISCNPKTQALNLAQLIEGGYEVVAVQPVDQFPQTVHIENIVILKKSLFL